MSNKVYGYINHSGWFKAVGMTERGAKIAAARAGYQQVAVGYTYEDRRFIQTAQLDDGKWIAMLE